MLPSVWRFNDINHVVHYKIVKTLKRMAKKTAKCLTFIHCRSGLRSKYLKPNTSGPNKDEPLSLRTYAFWGLAKHP